MAKAVPTQKVDYSPFENEEQFSRWVVTNYGSDVENACRLRINEKLNKKELVNPVDIVNTLTRATRQVDLARSGIRARFIY